MILSQKLLDILNPIRWKLDFGHQLPSNKVLFTFRLRYPKASRVKWKQMDVFKWQVTFKINGQIKWGLYANDGTWLETLYAIPFEAIPQKIQVSFRSIYNIDNLKSSNKVQTSLHTTYEIQCITGIYNLKLLYDETGNLVGKMIV